MALITTKELQEKLGVTSVTIWRWRKEGLPFKKIGVKSIRFDLAEVEAWIEKQNSGV
jgi:excisionase family DNA binding protein